MKTLTLAAATVAAMSTPLLAGGPTVIANDPMPAAAAAPADATNWSGAYAGLSFGRSSGDLEDLTNGGAFEYDDGRVLGAFVGYNLQRGSLVYGGELGFGRVSDMTLVGAILGGDDTLDSLLDLRGRVGFAFGNALVFGSVGYAKANTTINGTDSASLSGTSYGLGLDYKLGSRAFVGVDYVRRNVDGTNTNPGNTFDIESDIDTVNLRVGLSF